MKQTTKPMAALRIDPLRRTVSAVAYRDLAELQALVGGYIEAAYQWPDGDVLYVDEEGLFKGGARGFFRLAERPDQPLAGYGVLVGREIDEIGNTATPRMTLDALRARVRFPD
jgi:hypothetical protein